LKSPINNSTTKQLFTFSKAKRFHSMERKSSSSTDYGTSYYNIPPKRSKRATSFGYGTRSSFYINHTVNSPPPNQYTPLIPHSSKNPHIGINYGREVLY